MKLKNGGLFMARRCRAYRADQHRQQYGGERDPAVCSGTQELAIFGQRSRSERLGGDLQCDDQRETERPQRVRIF